MREKVYPYLKPRYDIREMCTEILTYVYHIDTRRWLERPDNKALKR